jgi:CHAT domain
MSKIKKPQHHCIRFTHRACFMFLSVVLLSDVGMALPKQKMAQVETQGTTSAGAQQAFDRGTKFYQQGTAESLREAKLKMWQQKQWQHPYYWAAFTLQGEWR